MLVLGIQYKVKGIKQKNPEEVATSPDFILHFSQRTRFF